MVGVKRARRKDARPGELLAAALDLFVEKGFAATRAEEVAHRAGVSKGTLFLYFSSKDELFKAVVRDSIGAQFSAWEAELDTTTDSATQLLQRCMTEWWERIGSTKAAGITKLMMSEANNFPTLAQFYRTEVIEPGNRLIRRILQRGMDSGEFRILDLHYGVYLVLAPMMFLAMWQHSFGVTAPSDQKIDPLAYIEAQLINIMSGLKAPSQVPASAATLGPVQGRTPTLRRTASIDG